jgi:hypothetical protein
MKQVILAPVGRAEPHDVQGWLEQGGGMGLQIAWQMPPAQLRTRLTQIQRRDGLGMVKTTVAPAAVTVQLPNPVHRFLATEMPAFVIEGALIWARACEQNRVTIHIGQNAEIGALWREVLSEMMSLGITGHRGWTATEIDLALPAETIANQKQPLAPDALTARLLPIVLWERADPPVTLLHTTGIFSPNTLFEIPLGLSLREFAFQWAGGIPADARLSLGGRLLRRNQWDLPLTYEQWKTALGSGVLEGQYWNRNKLSKKNNG